jgi:methyl-accepting chemotaxis protein
VFADKLELYEVYESLATQLGASLHTLFLNREKDRSGKAVEEALHSIRSKTETISSSSEGIGNQVEEVSRSVEAMVRDMSSISKVSEDMRKNTLEAVALGDEVHKILEAFSEQARRISELASVINEIAEVTNILSLNANIEAARTGAQGNGFSVIAREIKQLAGRTTMETTSINEMIETMGKGSHKTREAVDKILQLVKSIEKKSTSIEVSIQEQVSSSARISDRLRDAAVRSQEIFKAISEAAKN